MGTKTTKEETTWHPIETAPKDKKVDLALRGSGDLERAIDCRWNAQNGYWEQWKYEGYWDWFEAEYPRYWALRPACPNGREWKESPNGPS